MKNNLKITLSLLLLTSLMGCSSATKQSDKSETAKATPKNPRQELAEQLKSEMTKFIDASKPNRSVNQPGHEAAFRYLKDQFEAIAKSANGHVYVQEFFPDTRFAAKSYQKDFDTQIKGKFPPADPNYIKWKNFTTSAIKFVNGYKNIKGKNLILELPGSDKSSSVLYVGAHYDTITHNHQTMEFTPKEPTPGADDNASGVVALLQLAKHFAQTSHTQTIRFVAFDYEEIFFLGSYHLAGTLKSGLTPWKSKNESTMGLINLEMIGWSSKESSFKIYTRKPTETAQKVKDNQKEMAVLALGQLLEQKMARAVLTAAQETASPYSAQVLENGFDRSDNWSFWQKEIPAISVTEDWENDFNELNYHTLRDTPETLNYEYMSAIVESVKQAIKAL